MSGLSANTYSWGGEGSRLGRGGEASTLGLLVGRGALEKNLRIPSFFVNRRLVSSSEGTEDKSEESSDIMLLVEVDECRCGKEDVRSQQVKDIWADRPRTGQRVHWAS
jgi:hypothetical protein